MGFLPPAYIVFTGVCLFMGGGGGLPLSPSHNTSTCPMSFLGGEDTPWPGQDGGGVPQDRVPPGHVRMGGTLGWGTPCQGWGTPWPGQNRSEGYPKMEYPPPPPTRNGVPPHPGIGKQKDYFLRGGRYASCVHAGGLSCSEKISYAGSNLKARSHLVL